MFVQEIGKQHSEKVERIFSWTGDHSPWRVQQGTAQTKLLVFDVLEPVMAGPGDHRAGLKKSTVSKCRLVTGVKPLSWSLSSDVSVSS